MSISAATDLCTLDDVQEFTNKTERSNGNMRSVLQTLITNKTKAITNFIGFEQILSKDYTEYYNGNGTNRLFVKNTPINSITSIYDDTDWSWDTDSLIDSSKYRIVDSSYIVFKDTILTDADANIKITYNAGFSTIPYDLKQCCINEVIRAFNERSTIGMISKSDAKGNITRVEKGFLKSTIETLLAYKKIKIA